LINLLENAFAMLVKAWACARPAHVIQRALFDLREIPGFLDIRKTKYAFAMKALSSVFAITGASKRFTIGPKISES
jgi:hypothetical protein